MDINLGVRIYFETGESGPAVDRVIVEPREWDITNLVTEATDGVRNRKLVHVSLVDRAYPDRIVVRLRREGMAPLPDYVEARYSTPRQFLASARLPQRGKDLPPSEYVVGPKDIPAKAPPPSSDIELRNSALVEAVDGPLGRLDQVLTDDLTYRISEFGIRLDQGGQEVRVPVQWVAYIDPTLIRLATNRDEVGNLIGLPAGFYLPDKPGSSGQR